MTQAISATQAKAVTPATGNSNDDSNSITAHNSRSALKRQQDHQYNRTPEKSGMRTKVVQPATACRKADYSRDTINIRDNSSRRDKRNIVDINSSKVARIRLKESQQ